MTLDEHMTCKDLVDFLDDYVDETLDATVRRHFDDHLGECPQCQEYLDGYRATIDLAAGCGSASDAVPDDVPEDLVKAILAARKAPD